MFPNSLSTEQILALTPKTKKSGLTRGSKEVENQFLSDFYKSGMDYFDYLSTKNAMESDVQSTHFMIRWGQHEFVEKNFDKDFVESTLQSLSPLDYAFQLEEGSKTGFLHFQIYLQLRPKDRKRARTLAGVLSALSMRFAHVERAFSIAYSRNYCMKSETRKEGPWEKGRLGLERFPELAHFEREGFYPWQSMVLELLSQPVDPRRIDYFYDPEGSTGKSSFVKYLCVKRSKEVAFVGWASAEDFKTNVGEHCEQQGDPRVVLVDLARTSPSTALHFAFMVF